MTATPNQVLAAQEALGCVPGKHHHTLQWTTYGANAKSFEGTWAQRGCDFAAFVADTIAGATPPAPAAQPRERWEYGVEYPWGVEWGASVGMSHRYEYTADSVHGLAGGKPVWRRLRTSYAEVIGEPELVTAGAAPRRVEGGA